MGLNTVSQVLEHAHMAVGHVQNSFGLDHETASDIVQDVLLRLFRSEEEHLDHPKQYFLRACRWRAFQILSRRRIQDKALGEIWSQRPKVKSEPEVLIALEDEDKPKFFDQATPKQKEVLELLIEGYSQGEVSAILEIPESTVRMRIHLVRKKLNPTG
ncbi:MAG: sigma-70 family RNA polymerase sigma factor [Planctomycetes bacterium]|nr:sigma-70 family RNA polymerase sigma factor [Planctomycetota bacterium]